MAQTGYTPIKIYASTTASAVPLAANLDNTNGAELAINIADGKLFYKDSGGTVKVIAGTGGTGVVAGSNTQIQFNNNGVFGASSGLTWDGTKVTSTGLNVTGNTTLGDATADTLTVTALVSSNLLFADDTYNIGASGANRPRSLYLSANGVANGSLYALGDGGYTAVGTGTGLLMRYLPGDNRSYVQSIAVSGGAFSSGKALALDGSTVTLRYISGASFVEGLTVTSTGVGIKTITSPAVAFDNGGGAAILSDSTTIDPDTYVAKVMAGRIADGTGFSGIGIGINGGSAGTTAAIVQGGNTLYLGIGDGISANTLKSMVALSQGGLQFNSPQVDADFTINTQVNTAALFVEGSSGWVGVNNGSPIGVVDINTGGTAVITSGGDSASGVTIQGANSSVYTSSLQTGQLALLSNSSMAVDTGGSLLLGGKYLNGSNAFANYAVIKAGKENGNSGEYGGYLSIGTRANGSNITEAIRIKANRYVGIGTNNPIRRLSVYGSSVSGTQISINSGDGTDSAGIQITSARTYEIQSDNTSQFIIYDRTASAYRMTMASTGRTQFNNNLVSQPSGSVNMNTEFPDSTVGFINPSSTSGWGTNAGMGGRSGDCIWAVGSNTGGSPTTDSALFFGIGSVTNATFGSALEFTQAKYAKMVNNPFAFVKVSSDYTATSGAYMRFNSVNDSRGLNWDTGSYGFTAPVSGVYSISIGVRLESGSINYQYYQVEVNGSNIYGAPHFLGMAESAGQGFSTVSVSTIVKLAKNDVVRFPYTWDGAGNTQVYSTQTWCAVAFIG